MLKLPLRIILTIALVIITIASIFIIFYLKVESRIITSTLGGEFQLKIGEKTLIKDAEVTVTFIRVIEDTRCPVNVYCFWAGRVIVELSFRKKDRDMDRVNLSIPGDEEREFNGYVIRLLRVEPQREYPDKMEIPSSEYKITLITLRKTT
ncbi:MAG: hypothetical protein LZ172_05400 [Thaumarchaeota archaeon]|nr:hypothetical protein [Candidatus Geocrenenecus arthurdayi]MCL7389065.1 hypothetical protein [Candidatus Geocrenenecus arthurdayi]MCL7390510.1 hypothetical protein [Candidatus Geocrenenecus arthurdayi]MCL7395970.1 hypothetical protein [Candidatus Geocrenenecus arthurdayi]MCL7403763.1 hypothetical protein [Candidatus Geocrenenecus arthurdayi]